MLNFPGYCYACCQIRIYAFFSLYPGSSVFRTSWFSRTNNLKYYTTDGVDHWGLVLNEVAWTTRSTHHTTAKYSPGQQAFGLYTLLSIPHIADWNKAAKHKQHEINKSNQVKNKNCLEYYYVISNIVLIYQDCHFRKLEFYFLGMYKIMQIYTNGIVCIQCGATTERISILLESGIVIDTYFNLIFLKQ